MENLKQNKTKLIKTSFKIAVGTFLNKREFQFQKFFSFNHFFR